MQLTFEQHKFELHRPTYTWIFFSINTTVLHDRWLVESLDAELQIWKADYKVIMNFQLLRASTRNPHVVQRSTVMQKGKSGIRIPDYFIKI